MPQSPSLLRQRFPASPSVVVAKIADRAAGAPYHHSWEVEQLICLRCQGLMVPITLEDAESTTIRFFGWQCLLCGDVIDPEILANRQCHQRPIRSGARPPGSLSGGSAKHKKVNS